jgi:hypothetical protein
MPVSIATAAQFHNREEFLVWNPATGLFLKKLIGRASRMPTTISIRQLSSRREEVYVVPGQDLSNVCVIKHSLTGFIFLVSRDRDQDAWLNGDSYSCRVLTQKVVAPSGGSALLYSVDVTGSGDNLGAVVLTSSSVYVDTEFGSASVPPDTINLEVGKYLIFCSANVTPKRGDFVLFNSLHYRVEEWFSENGFLCGKAVQEPPSFVTATFYLSKEGAPVFDPVTGAMTDGSLSERKVSVTLDKVLEDGRPTDSVVESFEMYIDVRHIGFVPRIGLPVKVGARTYKVVSVVKSEDNLQWRVGIKP